MKTETAARRPWLLVCLLPETLLEQMVQLAAEGVVAFLHVRLQQEE